MRRRDPDLNIDRRAAIVQAAATCFVRRGFHATTMKDICAAAGMSPGTLYHYFRSKAAIVASIIEAERAAVAAILDRLEQHADIREGLAAALREILAATPEADLVLHAEVAAEILRDPQLRAQARAADAEATDRLARRINQAKATGQLPATLDPQATARAVGVVLDGILWRATLHGVGSLGAEQAALDAVLARLLPPVPGA
jgi:AcrR family transcriptional regulator